MGPRRPTHSAHAAVAVTLAFSALLAGCTPAFVPPAEAEHIRHKVRGSPLIVAFEGLQPFSGFTARNVARMVAADVDAAASATSGNWMAHGGLVREAHAHGQPVYVIGYSIGCSDALQLAQWCKLSGIPVRVLFLLDPAVLPGRVPDNVARVMEIRSASLVAWPHTDLTAGSLADRTRTVLEVVDLSTTFHGYLPYEAALPIRVRIGQDMSERAAGPPPR